MKNQKLNVVQVCEEGRAPFAKCAQGKKARLYNSRSATVTPRKKHLDKGRAGRMPALRNTSKGQELDAAKVWKQYEDLAVPRLKLSVHERAVYSYLLRHSRIEGKVRLRFSISWLRQGTGLTIRAARKAVRGLAAKSALRVMGRGREGHLVEVRLPEEIRGVRAGLKGDAADEEARATEMKDLEDADFAGTKTLREAIHAREGGRCFYCQRRMDRKARCIDHVIPLAHLGGNSYRNLVSSCQGCNAQKREWRAEDFVRWLYREGRLSEEDLKGRLRAVQELAVGKLRPRIEGNPGSNPTTQLALSQTKNQNK